MPGPMKPPYEIREVTNALHVYDNLQTFNHLSQKSFLDAHKLLMRGLIEKSGKYRTENVGILHGSRVAHVAPSSDFVPALMNDLFKYIKTDDEHALV